MRNPQPLTPQAQNGGMPQPSPEVQSGGINGHKERSRHRQSVAIKTTLADLRSWPFTLSEILLQFATDPALSLRGALNHFSCRLSEPTWKDPSTNVSLNTSRGETSV